VAGGAAESHIHSLRLPSAISAQGNAYMFKNSLRCATMRAAFALALLIDLTSYAHAGAVTVTLPDTANILGAGHATAPNPGGGSGGTLPPFFAFAANSGFVLRTMSVVGVTSLTPGFNGVNGEGNAGFATNISSYGGISGIVDTNRSGFLIGVFLDDTEPLAGTEPARLSFASPENFTTLTPLLRQTFLIGDGKSDASGAVQSFVAPPAATRLYFGFADAPNYTGLPGAFQDNSGRSLTVTFDDAGATPPVTAAIAAPIFQPTGLAMLGLGLACITAAYRHRRRVK
jgi:hypothetical protein